MATFVIAEVGVNHNGDIALAKKLVEAAANAGADAVKFQTFKAEDLVTSTAPRAEYQIRNYGAGSQFEMLRDLELTRFEFKELADHCKTHDIKFLSTAFGPNELDFLISIGMSAIKVASGEITNLPLLEKMARISCASDLPVYISSGMSTLGDVEAALKVFLDEGVKRESITLLHCLSSYPAPEGEVNLRAINTLRVAFGCKVGYSDHTLGTTAAVVAVALGAVIIEKHITLDTRMAGPDHRASLEPGEFKQMTEMIRSCENMLGTGYKQPEKSELDARKVARRSLRAAREIRAGSLIIAEDVICMRPGDGINPMEYHSILGRKAVRDHKAGDALSVY